MIILKKDIPFKETSSINFYVKDLALYKIIGRNLTGYTFAEIDLTYLTPTNQSDVSASLSTIHSACS